MNEKRIKVSITSRCDVWMTYKLIHFVEFASELSCIIVNTSKLFFFCQVNLVVNCRIPATD